MSARWFTFVLWALVAGSAVFWGLRLFTVAPPVPQQAALATPGVVAAADLTRLFGADAPPPEAAAPAQGPAPPPESARFQLVGVAAPARSAPRSGGIALIALDGKPARAYRVGAVIDGSYVLQDVQARSVAIGPRGEPPSIALELPPLPPPATGVPGAGGAPAAGQLPPMSPPAAPVVLQPPGMQVPQSPSLAVQPPPGVQMPTGAAAQARLRALRQAAGVPQAPAPATPAVQPQTDEEQAPPPLSGDNRLR